MIWIIIIAIILYLIYSSSKKKSSTRQNSATEKHVSQPGEDHLELTNTPAMNDAMNILTDLSHLSARCVCTLQIDPSQYSTAIDAFIRIVDIEASCGSAIDEFESFKKEKIAQSVAGKIEVAQMSEAVKTVEEDVNRTLAETLLNQNSPHSYPFSNLREFLKSAGNGDMEIKYPVAVLDANRQNQRQAFLKILQEKSTERFSNCKVLSSNATSVTMEFN